MPALSTSQPANLPATQHVRLSLFHAKGCVCCCFVELLVCCSIWRVCAVSLLLARAADTCCLIVPNRAYTAAETLPIPSTTINYVKREPWFDSCVSFSSPSIHLQLQRSHKPGCASSRSGAVAGRGGTRSAFGPKRFLTPTRTACCRDARRLAPLPCRPELQVDSQQYAGRQCAKAAKRGGA